MTTSHPWLASYEPGVPASINPGEYNSLVDLLDQAFKQHAKRDMAAFMGVHWTFEQVDELSRSLAAYFQSLGLAKGARIALMMPNVPQYAVAIAAVLRAGYVVVNVNPLYTPRELEHQLNDSGAAAIVVLENFAHTLEQVLRATRVRVVVTTQVGDLHVYYNALPSTELTPEVARQYGITRSANRALVNVALRRGEPGADVAVRDAAVALLAKSGAKITVIKDSPGFIAYEQQIHRVGGGATLYVIVESPDRAANERFVDVAPYDSLPPHSLFLPSRPKLSSTWISLPKM